MKSAFVSIVGRPSTGKSTLLNALCGHKVSIVSAVPQTTRNKVRGIVTAGAGQLVFIDTPGFHDSTRKFNNHMKGLVVSSFDEVDLVLYVMDLTRPPGEEERVLAGLVAGAGAPVTVALNKSDAPVEQTGTAVRDFAAATFPDAPAIEISALTGAGLPQLVASLFDLAPEGDQMYPEDIYTDQEPEFRCAEIIREKAIDKVRQEVPHSLYVEIADMEVSEDEQSLWVRSFLHVERESQKGILIGKGGAVIKQIRKEAQQELNELFSYKVRLDLRVKVSNRWRRRDGLLGKLIH